MTQLEKFKQLLGISDNNKDFILQFILDKVSDIIKDYCNIIEIPESLSNVTLTMAVDMYRLDALGSEDAPLGSISSINEGDISVSYKVTSVETKDSLIKDYKVQLNKYRKLVW